MPRGVPRGKERVIPEWFIEQLVDEEDIKEAKEGTLSPSKKVRFRCKDCGYEVVTDLHSKVAVSTGEMRRGCYKCGKKSAVKKRRSTRIDFPQWLIDSVYDDKDRERLINKSITMTEKIKFKCEKGHVYEMRINDRVVRTTGEESHGCYICNRYSSHRGKWEDEIDKIINPNGRYEVYKNYNGIITIGERHAELDLYYPELKLAVECNGSYWHATLGPALKTPKSKEYHRNKFMECKRYGIRLLSIFDIDFNDRMKGFLREIGEDKKRIYARELEIKEVELEEAREFCENYHLLGYSVQGNIRYGLYLGDELVAVMTFGKGRFGAEGYELVRYVVKRGNLIVGGSNRLLKRFEKEFRPGVLTSYSDNDFFLGNMYKGLGFREDGQTSIDYYWWNSRTGEKRSRQECSVKNLQKEYRNVTTEDETMVVLGFNKIYRCGSTRWVKENR